MTIGVISKRKLDEIEPESGTAVLARSLRAAPAATGTGEIHLGTLIPEIMETVGATKVTETKSFCYKPYLAVQKCMCSLFFMRS